MKATRTLITIAVLFAAVSLVAQIENRQLMKVNIPFSFTVGNQALPAGVYFVKAVTPEHSISLTSTDGKHATIVHDLPNYASTPSQNSRLVFSRYGSEYFLAQVWCKGDNVERSPMISKRQAEIAQSASRPDTEIVLAYVGR